MTDFDMATYFKRWQSQVFEELVEVEPITWA